jgi:hypothetical protein
MFCGPLPAGKALRLAVGLFVVLSVPATAEGARIHPRATRVGNYFVFTIPQEVSDPGDRRPR